MKDFTVPIRNQEQHTTVFYFGRVAVGAYQIHRISFDDKKLMFVTFSEN